MSAKHMVLGALALGAVTTGVVAFSGKALAYRGDPNTRGPQYTEERHAAMEKVFAEKNYDEWQRLMDGRGASRVVTRENFEKFVEIRRLRLEGKTAEADKIRTELGLGGRQDGSGRMNGGFGGRSSR